MESYLIIGQGSMGKRRVRCLLANKVPAEQITVFDTRADRRAEAVEKYGVRCVESIDRAMKDPAIGAVLVSVPGAFHIPYVLAAVRAGKHWFCEAPLSISLDGLDEVIDRTRKGRLIGALGCQVLFHPLARALHSWVRAPATGRTLSGCYTFGSYLPEWHPYEDYRGFYASNAAMGGGNVDVIAQEILWIRWVLDQQIHSVTCRMSKIGPLELTEGTPDHHEVILEFQNGLMLPMHFDLNDRTHERLIRLVGESSTAKWSTLENAVRIYDASRGQWVEEHQPADFNYEVCYQQEIGQFLRCIETGEPWVIELTAAREIVAVLTAVQLSARERRTVALKEVMR